MGPIPVIEIEPTSEYNLSTDGEYSISEFNHNRAKGEQNPSASKDFVLVVSENNLYFLIVIRTFEFFKYVPGVFLCVLHI